MFTTLPRSSIHLDTPGQTDFDKTSIPLFDFNFRLRLKRRYAFAPSRMQGNSDQNSDLSVLAVI